jgi:hypothetical protein
MTRVAGRDKSPTARNLHRMRGVPGFLKAQGSKSRRGKGETPKYVARVRTAVTCLQAGPSPFRGTRPSWVVPRVFTRTRPFTRVKGRVLFAFQF